MKEYILSDLDDTLASALIQFMVFMELPASNSRMVFDGNIWEFFTGIPYGFFGSIKIISKKVDPEMFQEALHDRYIKFINEESLPAKFLRRMKPRIERNERINLLQVLVPEAYPIQFVE